MSAPARSRPLINLAPRETVVLSDQAEIVIPNARSIVLRFLEFLDLVWRREPTLFIELGVAWTIGAWATTLLLFGTTTYTPPIAASIGIIPSAGLGLAGAMIAIGQIAAVVLRSRNARGRLSFAGAMWLGWLSFSILAGDYRLAGGYVYLGTAAAALLPFWRVVLDRRI